MANKIFLSQRNSHIIKRLNSAYVYESKFGVYGTAQTNNTGLNYPSMIASDGTYIYVCDNKNKRIVKLVNAGLTYSANVDVSTQVGAPYAITCDGTNIWVVGMKNNATLAIAKLTTALAVTKFSDLTLPAGTTLSNPVGICKDFAVANSFLIITDCVLKVTETTSFNPILTKQVIQYETDTLLFGGVLNTTTGFLYLNAKKKNYHRILKVNSSYKNVGDSDDISKGSIYLTQSNMNDDMFVYDNANRKVLRYDSDLNFKETVFSHTGTTQQLSCSDINGILEVNV